MARWTRLRPHWAWSGPRWSGARELDDLLVRLERELYVLMADVATAEANRAKLTAGVTLVTADMVQALEPVIDELTGRFPPLKDFVVPGHDRVSAALDVARTVIRRAERLVVGAAAADSRRRRLPEPPVGPGVDHGPLAGARRLVALPPGRWPLHPSPISRGSPID